MRSITLYFLLLISGVSYAWDECHEHRNAGMKQYYAREFDSALVHFEALAECDPYCDNYYDVACVASLAGKLDKAFASMYKAIEIGFGDTTLLVKDYDLKNMRKDERWPSVMERYKNSQQELREEIKHLKDVPKQYLLPYTKEDLWGYLDLRTMKAVTKPLFHHLSMLNNGEAVASFGNHTLTFIANGNIRALNATSGAFRGLVAVREPAMGRSLDFERGFKVIGKRYEFGSKYKQFVPYSSLQMDFAIIEDRTGFHAVDTSGKRLGGLSSLEVLYCHNYGKDSRRNWENHKDTDGAYLFFLKDSLGKWHVADSSHQKIISFKKGEVRLPKFDDTEEGHWSKVNRYVYVRKNKKWGIWDCQKRDWKIKPKFDEVLRTQRFYNTIAGPYGQMKTLKVYFLVRKKKSLFYVDLAGNSYRLKS